MLGGQSKTKEGQNEHWRIKAQKYHQKIALQDIPKVLTKLSSRLELAAVIVLSGDHFYTISIDANGSYYKYDDTKENIEIIKPSQLVNPQHLIFLNKFKILYCLFKFMLGFG